MDSLFSKREDEVYIQFKERLKLESKPLNWIAAIDLFLTKDKKIKYRCLDPKNCIFLIKIKNLRIIFGRVEPLIDYELFVNGEKIELIESIEKIVNDKKTSHK